MKVTELTYHYSKFTGLMNNYNIVTEANIKALNSQGSAYRENQKYLDSMTGRLNILKTTLESQYDKAISSDTLNSLISALTIMVSRMGSLNNMALILGTTFLLFKGTSILNFFKTLLTLLASSTMQMGLLNNVAITWSIRSAGLISTTQALKGSFIALGASLKGLFLSNPLGILALGVVGVIQVMNLLNQTEEETKRKVKETNEAFSAKQQSIVSLTEAYKQNFELAKTDEKAKKQLTETESELRKALGLSKEELNSQTKSLDDNIKKIREKSQEELKAYINQNKSRVDTMQDEQNTKKHRSLGIGVWDIIKKGTTYQDVFKKLGFDEEINLKLNTKDYYAKLQDLLERQDELIKNGVPKEYFNSIATEAEKVKLELDDTKNAVDNLNNSQKQYVENGIAGISQLSENQKKIFDMAKEKIEFTDTDQYGQQLTKILDNIKSFNGKNVEDFKKNMRDLLPNVDLTKFNQDVQKLSDSFFMLGMSEEDVKKKQKDLDDQYKESVNNIQLLQKAQNELNQDHKFSETTLEGLIVKYGGLLDTQKSETELLQDLKKLVEDEGKTFTAIVTAKLLANKEFFQSAIQGNENLWTEVSKAYGADLSNFTNIEQAKLKIDEYITQEIAKNWSNLTTMQQNILKESADLLGELAGNSANTFGDNFDAMMASANVQTLTGKTDEEMEQMSNRISGMNQAYDKMKKIAENAANNLKSGSLNLGSVSEKKKSDSSPSLSAEKDIAEKVISKDRYANVNIEIQKYNNLIKENEALQENATLEEKNVLLGKQIENYKSLQNAVHKKAELTRDERSGLMEIMRQQGFSFVGSGDNATISNSESILQAKLDQVNAHRNDKNKTFYNEIKAEYDDMVANFTHFYDIQQKDIPDLQHSWLSYKKTIGDIIGDKDKNKVDSIFKQQTYEAEKFEKTLSELEDEFNELADSQSQEKFDNFNKQIKTQEEYITDLNKKIESNGKIYNTLFSQEAKDELHEKTNALRDKRNTATKGMTNKKNTFFEERIKSFTADTYKYDDAISGVKEDGQLIKSLIIAGEEYENLEEKIKNTNQEIMASQDKIEYLKNGLNSLNFTTSENAKQEESRQKAIIEVTKLINQEELAITKLNSSLDIEKKRKEQIESLVRTQIEYEKKYEEQQIKTRERQFEDLNRAKQRYFEDKEDEIAIEEKQQQQYYTSESKALAINKLRTDLLDWNLDLQNTRITKFDDEINALSLVQNLEKSRIELLEKQISLEQQRQKLKNVEAEKNVKIFRSGKFQYEADPRKVIEEKQRLAQMELEYADYNKTQALTIKKNQLSDEKELWERSNRNLERSLEDERRIFDLKYEDMDKLVNDGLVNLYNTFNGNWDNILSSLTTKVNTAKSLYEQMMQYATANISGNVNNISSNSGNSSKPNILYNSGKTESDNTVTGKINISKLRLRDNGGCLSNGETAINLSGEDERVLSPIQTQSFEKLVNYLPVGMNIVDRIMSGINLTPNIPTSNNNSSTTNNTESINIDKIEIKNVTDANSFISQLKRLVRNS